METCERGNSVLELPSVSPEPFSSAPSLPQRRLVLVAPEAPSIPRAFDQVTLSCSKRGRLLKEMQRLRGNVYLEDGAIQPWQLTADGRHISPADYIGWHLLVLDETGHVQGGARYVERAADLSLAQFDVERSALALDAGQLEKVQAAIERERMKALQKGFHYAEVGGWALSKEIRGTPEAIRTALGLFALSRLLGGSVAITTATERNQSANILERIGGAPLNLGDTSLPSYYDPQYGSRMNILTFDSSAPNPRYESKIDKLASDLNRAVIICLAESAHTSDLLHLQQGLSSFSQPKVMTAYAAH